MTSFNLSPRAYRTLLLDPLSATKQPVGKFEFGLKPVVQLTAWLLAAFEIDLVRANPDLLLTRLFYYRSHCLSGGRVTFCT